jgi:hypothetical protein
MNDIHRLKGADILGVDLCRSLAGAAGGGRRLNQDSRLTRSRRGEAVHDNISCLPGGFKTVRGHRAKKKRDVLVEDFFNNPKSQ